MAFIKSYLMQVDIKQRMSSPVPLYKQGETSQLLFKVYDNGQLYDLSGYTRSELTFQLPDGSVVVGNGVLNVDNLIQYDFTGVEMAQVGTVKVILDIYSGVTLVSTQPFNIHIYDDMKNVDLSYIGILQDLIAEVQLLKDEINTALNETNQLKNEMEIFFTEAEAEEDIRVANEITRISSENIRIVNESTRQSNESGRISQEIVRQNNEVTRDSNESVRVQNEQARETAWVTIEHLASNLEGKLEWNGTTQYYQNNIVTLNGNSYIALQDNINQSPPFSPIISNGYWQLLAQSGASGNGNVDSVNGIFPDGNGNVSIDVGVKSVNGQSPDGSGNVNITTSIANVSGLQTELDNKLNKNGGTVSGDILLDTSADEITIGTGDFGYFFNENGIGIYDWLNSKNVFNYTASANQITTDLPIVIDGNAVATTQDVNTHAVKIASTTELGHVKVDGTTVTIDGNGVISSVGGGTSGVTSVNTRTGAVTLTATDVGLGNVTNESKSTMFISPSFTGTPTAPTATAGTNTTQVATTAFVTNGLSGKADISHTHTIANITNLQTTLDSKAPLRYTQFTITTSETIPLSRANTRVLCNSASLITLTVPPNSTAAFTIGDEIEFVQYGSGTVTLTAGAGVAIRSKGGKLSIGGQYSSVSLLKIGTDEWLLSGSLV